MYSYDGRRTEQLLADAGITKDKEGWYTSPANGRFEPEPRGRRVSSCRDDGADAPDRHWEDDVPGRLGRKTNGPSGAGRLTEGPLFHVPDIDGAGRAWR